MYDYRVIAPLTLHVGRIKLTREQYEPRAHCLQKTKTRDVYNIVGPVQFKAGEVIALDRALPKALNDRAEPINTAAAKSAGT